MLSMQAGKESRIGWTVVAAAFVLTFLGFGCAYSFAAFFNAFQAEFAASRGAVSLAFSAGALVWFIVGAPGGMLADRFGARRVAVSGVLCLTAALWLASRASSVLALYAAYSVGVGFGVGAGVGGRTGRIVVAALYRSITGGQVVAIGRTADRCGDDAAAEEPEELAPVHVSTGSQSTRG